MTAHAIVYDCEYLVSEGAYQRFWCGPYDPDPIVVQIGAVRLELAGDFPISAELDVIVKPRDRYGAEYAIPQTFVDLTGITAERIASEGTTLETALARLDAFAAGARLWSWGKDELNLMAISCYVAGLGAGIPATRFENACKLCLEAGMPYEEIVRTRSSDLARSCGVETAEPRAHDGLADARSVALGLQKLLRDGRLTADHFRDVR